MSQPSSRSSRRGRAQARGSDSGQLLEASLLLPAFAAVRSAGADPDRILRRLGLDIKVAPAKIPYLSEGDMRRILDACGTEIDDPLFGLRIVDHIEIGSFGITQYVAMAAPTVGESLAGVARFSKLLDGVTLAECKRSRGEVTFTLSGSDAQHLGVHASIMFLAEATRRLRQFTNRRIPFVRAWTSEAPPEKRKLAQALGISNLEVHASSSGFVVSDDVAGLPLLTADPVLHGILCDYAATLPAKSRAPKDLRGIVQQLVKQQLAAGDEVTLASTARLLGTSARTFQRRLLVEGASFHDLVDSVRAELAREMLLRREHSVADVAYALQYSDVSAFIRAFRRWTGTTPGGILKAAAAAATGRRRR